jgi:predicted PurR-regulated permease PerM
MSCNEGGRRFGSDRAAVGEEQPQVRIAVTTAAVIWILIVARNVLQPLAIGLLVWLVLGAISHKLAALLPPRLRRGKAGVRIAGSLGTLAIVLTVGVFLAGSIARLRENIPLYEENLNVWISHVAGLVGEADDLSVAALLGRIDVTSFAISVAGSTASYIATLFVVISYAVFIFVEASAFDAKVAAFAGDPAREHRLRQFLAAVRSGVDDFLAVQTLIGIVQAVPTYFLLLVLGVDAPLFLAVVVFVFSYIPTIGTLIGIIFPTALTLLQFASLGPALVVVAVLGTIQIVCSNVLAPQLMSRSLNLSPLVVLFAVFAGGALWGIVGALIAVPALTIIAIVCAEEPGLRRVAILLSARGTLPSLGRETDEGGATAVAEDGPR